AALAAAALLFPLSIAWVQTPAQRGLGALALRLLGGAALRRYGLLAGAPGIVVTGVVQEGVKLLVAMVALRRLGVGGQKRAGLAVGAAVGAGYGGMEAFWTFNVILAMGWSWATVQLLGPQAFLGFVERLYVVPFHIGAAALAAYGCAAGRSGRFLLLAIALHSALNYGALLAGAGVIGVAAFEAWGALVAAVAVGLALWLRKRAAP
ncbi:MAG: hypothetical protein QME94_10930, partial [Anaerolineae bacterium]|nr:hypothetical protein [Anaerolineae bacterium]